jgi:DNA processing protein
MTNDLLYQIALTKVEHIGDVHAKALVNQYQSAEQIFKAKTRELEKLEGIGKIRAESIKNFKGFNSCEKEMQFIIKNSINPVFINDENYPKRLLHCYDSPVLLYHKGNANLNPSRVISVVGTRNNSDYGKSVCQQFVNELKNQNVTIVSGLAYGIDTIAHKSAIENELPTIAVMAHGLDRIYPDANTHLAKNIMHNGGLLTEFTSGTKPDKQNFPIRNRITAALSDALIVIETGIKGGSLITAEIAFSYNKDVMAFPGRSVDVKSTGCNALIKNQKAIMIENANDFLQIMGWNLSKNNQAKKQRALFIELNQAEKTIVRLIEEKQEVHIDHIAAHTQLSYSTVAGALLNLEINGLIVTIPGNRYRIL